MGIWKGLVRIRVFDFNMKVQRAHFPKKIDHMVDKRIFECLDGYYHYAT